MMSHGVALWCHVEDKIHSKLVSFFIYFSLKWNKAIKMSDIKTKHSSSSMLYGNITLFGVAADHLSPAGSSDSLSPQIHWYYHMAHLVW